MYNYLNEQLEILSSKGFRRLEQKQQIVPNFEDKNVHITNRLTHSLEVGAVAKMITERLPSNLYIDKDQIFNICLLHDIGHPSLGHFFEEILNSILKKYGYYFEGNANNFVIVDKEGIKLSNKTLVSLIKYPFQLENGRKKGIYEYQFQSLIRTLLIEYVKQTKNFMFNGYGLENTSKLEQIENILKQNKISNSDLELISGNFRTLESTIMEAADDITYLTHDLRDFIMYRSDIEKKDLSLKDICDLSKYDNKNEYLKYLYTINSQNATSIIHRLKRIMINNISFNPDNAEIEFSKKSIEEFKLTLRKLLFEEFIMPFVRDLEQKANEETIFNKFFKDINNPEVVGKIVFSDTYRKLINETNDIGKKYRYMCNYLAEKTDKWLFD